MARKIQSGTGTFIKHTNKKRPGRHAKKPTTHKSRKKYRGQGRR